MKGKIKMNTRSPFTNLSPLPGFRSIVAMLLGVSVLLSGCTTLRSVPVPAPGQSSQTVSVKVGDKVEVQTKSGEKLAFTVTAIEPEALVGKAKEAVNEMRVRYQDIASLQVERVDKVRTTVAVVAIIVVLAGAGAAYAGSHVTVGPVF
jgi:hypothetical protein